MPLGQMDPLTFVVGRQLAINQNVDASTATRHGLVGALLGSGIFGPIIARQLAIRDAPAPVAPGPITHPDSPGVTPDDAATQIVKKFEAWIKTQEHAERTWREGAAELERKANESQAERVEALKQLCRCFQTWQEGSEPPESSADIGPSRENML